MTNRRTTLSRQTTMPDEAGQPGAGTTWFSNFQSLQGFSDVYECAVLDEEPRAIERSDDDGKEAQSLENNPSEEAENTSACFAQGRSRSQGRRPDRKRLETQARLAASKGRAIQLHHRHRGEMV